MTTLQRSTTSFRRQGSSGLVWDDRFVSGELNKVSKGNHHHHHGDKETESFMRRSRSEGGGRVNNSIPAIKVSTAAAAAEDPPSPKFSACGFCGAFAKPAAAHHEKRKSKNHQRKM